MDDRNKIDTYELARSGPLHIAPLCHILGRMTHRKTNKNKTACFVFSHETTFIASVLHHENIIVPTSGTPISFCIRNAKVLKQISLHIQCTTQLSSCLSQAQPNSFYLCHVQDNHCAYLLWKQILLHIRCTTTIYRAYLRHVHFSLHTSCARQSLCKRQA